MKKINVLHVFKDEKFFDRVLRFFLALPNVNNLFYYYSKNTQSFKYIKNTEVIINCDSWDDYTQLFSSPDIDIIYFHSISVADYKLFKYIDPSKIVIWWCWGYDIYNSYGFLKPLINIKQFKPETSKIAKSNKNIVKRIGQYLKSIQLYKLRELALSRVDYFTPVIPFEYHLMKNNPLFKARPFMIEGGPGFIVKRDFVFKEVAGNIIIGNSLTLSNNHLDILDAIKNISIAENRSYIVPINYGNDLDKKHLKKKAQHINANFKWLESFIPNEEYQEIYKTVTHAIFGHMRQQAMGNINLCLRTGVKVFLYKDSIIYKQLKNRGYFIYSIEEDLNPYSLEQTLSKEEAYHNYNLYYEIAGDKVLKATDELKIILSNR